MQQQNLTTQLQALSDQALLDQTFQCAKREQQTTLELLHHLHEVQHRRLFAKPGYQSLWEYAVKGLGYGAGAASERVSAMRLVFGIPEALQKLQSGELNLSTAAQVQRHFQKCEANYTPEQKVSLLEQISGQSVRDTEKILLAELGELDIAPAERVKRISKSLTEYRFYADEELTQMMERMKELEGNLELVKILKLTLGDYLKSHDPLLKPVPKPSTRSTRATRAYACRVFSALESSTRASALESSTRQFTAAAERETTARSGGQCEYIDSQTGRRCESRYRIQTDHVIPFGQGGRSSASNARHLCPAHNQYEAIQAYGRKQMARYF